MSTWCRRVRVDPAGRHEPHRPVDLAGHPLVPLAGPGGEHELLVPLVHPGQVAHPGAGHRADQVHRRRRVGVGADHPGRVGDPGLRGGGQRVDDVAAVGRQAERIQRGRARLGVLAGDPGHLDHRHRRAVGEHHGHLQQGADVAPDVRLGVVDVGLGAVAALQQERLAAGHRGQLVGQLVDLAGHRHRRHRLQHRPDGQHLLGVRPLRLLRGRAGERVVQPRPQLGRQRRQARQNVRRDVDRPVHVEQPRRKSSRAQPRPARRCTAASSTSCATCHRA